ncbi:MAG: adenylate/guanylate cyclase domain-containing protein [Candidatus Hydrogenedentota bacterium]|nr:MAG: adenylate/guanylate cyclase domain-containing protein [Candidatus Hydrogenedentota bacterium]
MDQLLLPDLPKGFIDAAYRKKQQKRRARYGKIASYLILTIVPALIFQDFYVVKAPQMLPWRLLNIAAAIVYLGLSLFKRESWLAFGYQFLLMSVMAMMCGLMVALDYSNLSLIGNVTTIFIVTIMSGGGAAWLAPVLLVPILGLYTYAFVWGNVPWSKWPLLSNPLIISIVALTAAEVQERLRYREFSANMRALWQKGKSDFLLGSLLPKQVIRELDDLGEAPPFVVHNAVILYATIDGLNIHTLSLPPERLLNLLGIIFQAFDQIIEQKNLEKLKIAGEGYYAGAGVFMQPHQNLAEVAISAAREMILWLQDYSKSKQSKELPEMHVKVGIYQGTVIGGLLKTNQLIFDIWGEAVQMAMNLQAYAPPDSIVISEEVKSQIQDTLILEKLQQWNTRNNFKSYCLRV